MKLHLARHIGFIRMSGCLLVYARGRTLSDHQLLVCQTPGFRWMTIHQRGALARALRDEVLHCADRERLLSYALPVAVSASTDHRAWDAFRILPPVLLRHLGTELGINTPDLASLRALCHCKVPPGRPFLTFYVQPEN
ncbi:hypothetical protein [Cupriavidus sp. D39]|uniref:hypothetical protein n=1 Tax=Cupriavidus sp. D39 TaxID=2997877 RepID=UPI002270779C|nr:hypothetical protein [Cupriavidus sp. D39]MCY0854174.1 hypothetical protein [Cupriavidus sp. D39]